MEYTYMNLESYARSGQSIGNWHGAPIYVFSKAQWAECPEPGVWCLIYDDGNALVYNGYQYGTLNKEGYVREWRERVKYKVVVPKQKKDKERKKEKEKEKTSISTSTSPGSLDEYFVQLSQEIDRVLAQEFDFNMDL